jgi:hypothetical protein
MYRVEGKYNCNILFYSILLFLFLSHPILSCYILSYPILFCSILFYYYSVLFYSILFYSILFYSIMFCSIDEKEKEIQENMKEKRKRLSCFCCRYNWLHHSYPLFRLKKTKSEERQVAITADFLAKKQIVAHFLWGMVPKLFICVQKVETKHRYWHTFPGCVFPQFLPKSPKLPHLTMYIPPPPPDTLTLGLRLSVTGDYKSFRIDPPP